MGTNPFTAIIESLRPEGAATPGFTKDPGDWTENEFLAWQVKTYNSIKKEPQNGYSCPACGNRGYFATINYAGDFALKPCSCSGIKTQIKNAQNSGFGEMLDKYTFEGYEVKEDWQRRVKEGALLYTQQKELPWLYIGGMSGAGKSHICTAAATRILQQGKIVKYVLWRDIFHKAESLRYKYEEYNELIRELAEVEVLIIDDFLKGMDGTKQASALEIAFDIVNRRYNTQKPTIFSSEYQLGDIETLDKALHGRIKERCGKFSLNIKNEDSRNYRKR
jgi:DNA replication protein DnaC